MLTKNVYPSCNDADAAFMRRALYLASLGLGTASPNPMVGCVIVWRGRIIGEGFHHRCGEGHAEVNAVRAVLNGTAACEACGARGVAEAENVCSFKEELSDSVPLEGTHFSAPESVAPQSAVAKENVCSFKEALSDSVLLEGTHFSATAGERMLRESTMYVTLEPCSHYGKTPPCAELIIKYGIPRVVVCCSDPNPKVNGRGIAMLRAAGVKVTEHFLEEEGRQLGRRFFTVQEKGRPYVILKWAESADGFIAAERGKPCAITGAYQQVVNHSYRAQEDAIMVGTGTLLSDNPRLNARLYYAEKQPLRVSLDLHGRVLERLRAGVAGGAAAGEVLHFFDGSQPSLLFVDPAAEADYAPYAHGVRIAGLRGGIDEMLRVLQQERVGSLIVEGGTELLQSFIDSGLYDEVRVLKGEEKLGSGYSAPVVPEGRKIKVENGRYLQDYSGAVRGSL